MEMSMLGRDVLLIIISVVVLLISIILSICKVEVKKFKYLQWIPVVSIVLHFLIYGFNIFLIGIYISAILWIILFILRKIRWVKWILIIFITLINLFSLFKVMNICDNYMSMSYVEGFTKVHNTIKEKYVLTIHKQLDLDKMYYECLPVVKEAEVNKDPVAFYIAMQKYAYMFYDGHVDIMGLYNLGIPYGEWIREKACDRMAGNDYGLSMITLESGDTVAILVEQDSKAEQTGIHTGTVITKWNDIDIRSYKENMQVYYPNIPKFPSAKNEEYFKSFMIAGQGEGNVEISFIDNFGNEQSCILSPIGNYSERLNKAISLFQQRKIKDKDNLYWEIVSNDCGYIYIKKEFYEGVENGNYESMKDELQKMIDDMKQKGVKSLIVDLRCNSGGDDLMGIAFTELFTSNDFFYYADGSIDKETNKYNIVQSYNVNGTGEWTDIPIYVLVNASGISSGDGLAYNLNKLSNVTLIGTTGSSSSFQAVDMSNICVLKDGIGIRYSGLLQVDEDAAVMIDTDRSRTSVLEPEVQIEINEEYVKEVFEEEQDYELNYTINYIKEEIKGCK